MPSDVRRKDPKCWMSTYCRHSWQDWRNWNPLLNYVLGLKPWDTILYLIHLALKPGLDYRLNGRTMLGAIIPEWVRSGTFEDWKPNRARPSQAQNVLQTFLSSRRLSELGYLGMKLSNQTDWAVMASEQQVGISQAADFPVASCVVTSDCGTQFWCRLVTPSDDRATVPVRYSGISCLSSNIVWRRQWGTST